jgi:adenylyltransferase/sulfurtransferase
MFYYEGEHLTMKMADYQAFDDECAEHTCWEPVQLCDMTLSVTVEEALAILSYTLNANDVAICLSGDSYVDYVSERSNDRRTEVMLPARKVEAFVEQHPHLRGILMSEFYQHEYHRVDKTFPYQSLSLGELGIPVWDILHVLADGRDYYFEMSKV